MGWDTLAFFLAMCLVIGGIFTLLAIIAEFISNHF